MSPDPYTHHRDHTLAIIADLPPAIPNTGHRIALAQVHATLALAAASHSEIATLATLDVSLPCGSCDGYDSGRDECPKSRRPCGHHCNHSWEQDVCCWCGKVFPALEAECADPAAPEAVEDRQPYEGPQFNLVMSGHDLSLAPHYPGQGRWCEACPIPAPATPGTEFGPTGPGMG